MLSKDFSEFVELLNSAGVEYMLVGGYALAAHGHPRYTGDIDFWVRVSDENLDKLLGALDRFGFGSLGLKKEDFLTPGAVVQLGYPPARIDLIAAIDGVDFGDCYPRRVVSRVGHLDIPVIGVEDLKANKKASGRAKDLADLESLSTVPRRKK